MFAFCFQKENYRRTVALLHLDIKHIFGEVEPDVFQIVNGLMKFCVILIPTLKCNKVYANRPASLGDVAKLFGIDFQKFRLISRRATHFLYRCILWQKRCRNSLRQPFYRTF